MDKLDGDAPINFAAGGRRNAGGMTDEEGAEAFAPEGRGHGGNQPIGGDSGPVSCASEARARLTSAAHWSFVLGKRSGASRSVAAFLTISASREAGGGTMAGGGNAARWREFFAPADCAAVLTTSGRHDAGLALRRSGLGALRERILTAGL